MDAEAALMDKGFDVFGKAQPELSIPHQVPRGRPVVFEKIHFDFDTPIPAKKLGKAVETALAGLGKAYRGTVKVYVEMYGGKRPGKHREIRTFTHVKGITGKPKLGPRGREFGKSYGVRQMYSKIIIVTQLPDRLARAAVRERKGKKR
jgi:hypothetical protein